MRILVTGAAGFIGSVLVKYLSVRGDEVLEIDATIEGSPSVLDVENFGKIAARFKPQAIVALAAHSHSAVSAQDQNRILSENVTMTWATLQAASRCGGCRVVLAGSASEYGPSESGIAWTEDDAPRALDTYGLSKAMATAMALGHSLDTITLRFSNVFGPGQRKPKFIPTMIERVLDNETVTLNGCGSPIRNWVHVSDVVSAIVTVIDRDYFEPMVFNIGGSPAANIEIANMVLDECRAGLARIGRKLRPNDEILVLSNNPGGSAKVDIDSRLAKDILRWIPKVSLKDGIAQTVQHYLEGLTNEQHGIRAA